MAFPGLVAVNNLSDTENKEVVWDNLGNGIDAVILATNFIRNNTMVGAVAGTPGTSPTNYAVGAGGSSTRSIVGIGTENDITYIDIQLSSTGANNFFIVPETNTQIAAVNGQNWTSSFYVRLIGGTLTNLTLDHNLQENNISGEFLVASIVPFVPTTSALFDQRITITRTLTNGTAAFVLGYLRGIASGAYDVTLRIGMPQLERSEYLTPPIATTNAAASALATVSLAIEGDDILELTGARIASVADFVRIKGLATPAQPRLTTAAANAGSGIALRNDALVKASPSSEGDFFITRGTLDGQSLRVNGLAIASISGSPFSGSTASCPLSISSFAAPTNLRLNNAMTSGTLAFPEKAIPIETNDFILYAKAGQS
jgi:hypothetical protein